MISDVGLQEMQREFLGKVPRDIRRRFPIQVIKLFRNRIADEGAIFLAELFYCRGLMQISQ